jgi:hypothetical protein
MALPFFLPPIQIPQVGFSNYIKRRNRKKMNETPKYIDMGSYGVIYKDPSHPEKVIKILSPGTNINAEIEKAQRMADLTGDDRQRVEKIQITKNDVPSNALTEYQHLNSMHSFMKNNQPIPALSMPYLGVDLFTYLDKRPFSLPEELFINQCHKLLRQTSILYRDGQSHGDLRSENIVFDGREMTIIDFDLFGTFEEVAKVYESGIHKNIAQPWSPPEFLILLGKVDEPNDYLDRLRERNRDYFSSIGIDLKQRVLESNVKNMEYMAEHNMSMEHVIPYLDNFGLGMALLEVLAALYPKPTTPKLIRTRDLLEKITHFKISKRMKPDDAFAEMDKIHKMSGGRRRSTGKTRRTRKTRRARKNRRTLKRV